MNPAKPDPLAIAEPVLAPLRMIYARGNLGTPIQKPSAICVTPEIFNAIVQLPVMVRELREANAAMDRLHINRMEECAEEVRELRDALETCAKQARAALERSGG